MKIQHGLLNWMKYVLTQPRYNYFQFGGRHLAFLVSDNVDGCRRWLRRVGRPRKPRYSLSNRVSICCRTWYITASGLAVAILRFRYLPTLAGIKHVLRRAVHYWTGTSGNGGVAFGISLLTGIQPELWVLPVLRPPYWICCWTVHRGMSGIAPLSREHKKWGQTPESCS
jgi:hypothetical protein